jgi:hypothetical protein
VLIAVTVALLAAYAVHARAASAGSQERHWSQAQLAQIITARFGHVEAQRAICVAEHESSGPAGLLIPTAENAGQDGMFQIDSGTWNPALNPRALPVVGRVDWSRIFNPVVNTLVAYRIWKHSGWLPAWTADAGVCGLS